MGKVLYVSPAKDYKTVDDLRKAKGLKGGATSAGGTFAIGGSAAIEILGLDGKIVTGWKSKADLILALGRGEVDFVFTGDDGAARDAKAGYVNNLMIFGRERSRVVPDVKTLFEHGVTLPKEHETVFEFLSGGTAVMAPPGTPPERVEYLRDAFAKISDNVEMQEEFKKITQGVWTPFRPGKQLQESATKMKGDKELATRIQDIVKKNLAAQ